MNEFNYTRFALKEVEDAVTNYKNGNVDIHIIYYKFTTLIFWVGAFLDKKHNEIKVEDKQAELAIRFAWNVLKHDKTIFKIVQKAYVLTGNCEKTLNSANLISRQTIIWNDLNDTNIKNKNGLEEYNDIFMHAELGNTFKIIKNIVEKYCVDI